MNLRQLKVVSCILIFAGTMTCALEAQTGPSGPPLARIGTDRIYDNDLTDLISSSLWQLHNQEHELRTSAVEFLLNQRVLEAEAKEKGASPEALLNDVYTTVPPPTAGEVEAYYFGQKDRLNRPFSDVKQQMEKALTDVKRQQARQDYISQLRRKSDIAILLQKPIMEVTADPSRLRGNPDAAVTIIEFSDYQCPYCQAAEPTVKQVLEKYKDKVRLGFRDLPLRQLHPQAQQAAEASRCAGEQGKFWEYHDLLFVNQQLDPASLTSHATKAGLDVDRFEGCLKSEKYKPMIENDLQTGMKAGVTGTPAFFINGKLISGSQPLEAFEKIIDEELARDKTKTSARSTALR